MILMNLKADNLLCFNDFRINLSYPKKIVNSNIEGEYLSGRPNFRYKKVNIIMGSNASGKTALGYLIMAIFNFITKKSFETITKKISDKTNRASFETDFAVKEGEEYWLYRICAEFLPPGDGKYSSDSVKVKVKKIAVRKNDSYEMCVERLEREDDGLSSDNYVTELEKVKDLSWFFIFPEDSYGLKISGKNEGKYLQVLETILKVLDQAIVSVDKLSGVDNSYVIRLTGTEVIVQDGEIIKTDVLSTGTKAGLAIAAIMTSIIAGDHGFYYCDEKFSYINSDIERALLALMIEKLVPDTQLFFTTHNTDVFEMPLPKHSFNLLRKEIDAGKQLVTLVNVGDYLKKSTDSVRNAIENDLFLSSPSLEILDTLEDM